MIELDSLKFTVDTKELVAAVKEVENLQTAVSKLNKPLAENAKISAKVAQENAKIAIAEQKVAQAKNKTAEGQAKAEAAQNRAVKAAERVTKSTAQQVSVLERQKNIYEFMTQGYSKGQATVLAQAKAQGALADELLRVGAVLKDQRKLVGGDPFDKSTSGLISLRNAMVELQDEARTSAAGIQMTSKQYKEFARDKLRIIEISKAEGVSFAELKNRLRDHGAEFVKLTTAVNELTAAEKERERNQRLQANAVRAIAAEDEKMESILRSLNVAQTEHTTVSERAARSIANYERNLRLAGITGEQAATKLDKFRKSAMMAAQAEEKRKVDMLSRALAPQISDVVVSLGSGMNPMTVLLQQGLQVRDLIGLSGVAVQDLQVAFRSAASDMVSSIKGTAVALGSLLLGALTDASRAILNFGLNITGTNLLLDAMRTRLVAMTGETSAFVKAFDFFGKGVVIGVAGSIATLTAGFIAYLVALKDVVSEQNDLARNLALTGASLGVTKDEAMQLVNSLEGIPETKATAVLNEMAKAGGFTREQFEEITKAATRLEKYAGVSIEETVKNFAKLQDSPSKNLAEFAAKNGLVEVSILKQIKTLENQKKFVEASELAIKAYSESLQATSYIAEESLHPITKIWIDIKSAIGGAWEQVKEFARSDVVVAPLRIAFQTIAVIVSEVWFTLKAMGQTMGGIFAAVGALASGMGLNAAAEAIRASKEDSAKLRAEQDAYVKSVLEGTKAVKEDGKARQKNAKDAEGFLRSLKKTPKSDAEKEADRIQKAFERDSERFNDLLEESKKKIEGLTQAEKVLLDVKSSEDWKNYTKEQKTQLEQKAEMAKQDELAAIAAQKLREIEENKLKTYIEVWKTRDELMFDIMEESDKLTQSIDDQTQELQLQLSVIGLIGDEQSKALKLKKLEIQYEKELRKAREIFDPSARKDEENAALRRYQQARKNVETELAIESANKTLDSLTDAVVTGLFEGGKAGSQKLRDIIEAELRKPITIFIRAVISDIFVGSGVGGSNSVNALTKLSDTFSNFSKIGSNLGSSLGSLGSWLEYGTNPFSQQGSMLAAQEAGMGTLSGSLSQFGSMAGNALAGAVLFKGISNGYSISKGADIIGTLASAYFGPVGGAIGGLVNRAFGRKLKDTGIQGTFSGEDNFSGNTYQFYKGGWFRSNKTKYSAMDPMLQSGLGQAYGMLTARNKAMADYIGIDSQSKLSGFKSNVKFSTNGMNEQQIQQKLEEVLGNVAEEQAKLLLGTYETVTKKSFLSLRKTEQVWKPSEFVRFGETASEALTRLSTSLKAVNTFLENTNDNLLAFSVAGADMASSLVDLFGGVDNFNSVSSSYYQNFFTDQEKLTKGNELLAKAFADLNIAMPSTVSAYRQLVESQDLTTESGRETFTALLTLSSVFYELKTASEEAVSSIVEEINRLRGVVSTSSLNGFEGTKASFLQAISLAQGGDATAMASLPGLSQSLETMFGNTASSLEDVNRFRSWLANSMGSIVPAFADGGFHSGGVRLVGENGPELEVTGPSRIFSNSDTASMLSGGNVVEAIIALNNNLDLLRAEVRADVQHNAKTAKLLDRVIPEGDSIVVSGSIDGGTV